MAKIHGGAYGEKAQELFYTDAQGNMMDADLHNNIIFAGDNQIDEQIMAPIRAKYAKRYFAEQKAKPKPAPKKKSSKAK